VTRISHVINFEPPIDAKQYIHRSGRTGRMGRSGTVVTLATAGERSLLDRLAAKLGIELKRKTLSHGEWIDADSATRGRDSRNVDATPRDRKGESRSGGSTSRSSDTKGTISSGRDRNSATRLATNEAKEHLREPNQTESRRDRNAAETQN